MMKSEIVGVSGSPVKNSNTDRLIKAIIKASGLSGEFVKLSDMNVGPCRACLKCVADNICKTKDDFPALALKVRQAKALIVGGYPPYGTIDGRTTCFLERLLFSQRHQKGLLKGKLGVIVVAGIEGWKPGALEVIEQIRLAMEEEEIEILGSLFIKGNTPCLSCGVGETCELSTLSHLYGPQVKVQSGLFSRVEDQSELWQKAEQLGQEIAHRLGRR
jgi:multimeric flavodoxin WrbA